MTIAVIAEKPSVARDIARVIGASKKGEGYLHGNGWVVSWALGHLVRLAEPHEIDTRWKRWQRAQLPMLPQKWPLVVEESTRVHFSVVRRILTSPKIERVVCATDAGREGEYIFRLIAEAVGCDKPVSRLWISSLTTEAISAGFQNLRDGAELDCLADAARGRSRADWLVGMNLSRACTLAHGRGRGDLLSVGRVQTPTLAMVVERELAIRSFVPEPYQEVVAEFELPEAAAAYRGVYFRGAKPSREARRLPAEVDEAEKIVDRVTRGTARVETVEAKAKSFPPPLLYDLTELQRHANRLFGFSAKKTLGLAQALYERAKLLSYPRTDSRHLSRDVADTLAEVVQAIRGPYEELLAPGTGKKKLGRRFVNDAKVSDHHALIPTATAAEGISLSGDEQRIYDLVCRRLLACWHKAHRVSQTRVITAVSSEAEQDAEVVVDRFSSTGTTVEQEGWKVLDRKTGKPARKSAAGAEEEDQDLPAELQPKLPVVVQGARAVEKTTRPPKRFTEATLLTAMETAGKALDDRELKQAMRDSGLGTPATRAEIIETLLRREYVLRSKRSLAATDLGIRLIEVVHPWLKSPAMTGEWEARLTKIEQGEGQLAAFIEAIEDFVRSVVGETFSEAGGPPPAVEQELPPPLIAAEAELHAELRAAPPPPATARREQRSSDPAEMLRLTFGHASFRPYQEEVCESVISGADVLLVMPTGAGKSLCYQLPGLVRGGTTLVVSPLIALMEDQVFKMQELGLAAERIHSGRPRSASREVCGRYLDGELDFLMIAPERLAVPGFTEMLARCKPTLIAVDEAHCISHWGHDFRPEYRMLGERLPQLRPAPVIGLTATATPLVQDDIVEQLGLADGRRFIRGFRRHNIAVEVVEAKPSARRAIVDRVVGEPARRPALVYTPTRKEAEAVGVMLATRMSAAAYHAGMAAAARSSVQEAFLAGELEVVVATIAFGMGVDKADIRTVIHTGLPGTLEAYYQEIGRVGRDGKPSRAVLLYSWADRHTHEFFLKRDYPEPGVLELIFDSLVEEPMEREELQHRTGLDDDAFVAALEKLWIHGGALVDPEERACRGHGHWRAPYVAQRKHRHTQLEQMLRFAGGRGCRMQSLVTHFGDTGDLQGECGICDHCRPEDCLAQRFRDATAAEQEMAEGVLNTLRERDGQTTGQLSRELGSDGASLRRGFERVLDALVRELLVETHGDSFVKDGRTIRFQRAWLTASGRMSRGDFGEGLRIAEEVVAPGGKKKKKARQKGAAGAAKGSRTVKPEVQLTPKDVALFDQLREWRLKEARRRRVPAFRICTDRTLEALVRAHPSDQDELLDVSGIGTTLARKYGKKLLAILNG